MSGANHRSLSLKSPLPGSLFCLPAWPWLAAAGLVFCLGLSLWPVFPRLMLAWQQWASDEGRQAQAVWLPDYRVDIDARALPDVANLSGLTYHPQRATLFAVTNKEPEIIEISLEGDILRRIPVTGLVDPEAIEYVGDGMFVLADERTQTLVATRIDAMTTTLDLNQAMRLTLALGVNGNKGFEGLGWDPQAGCLYVAKERDPHRIYEIRGFPYASKAQIEISEDARRDSRLPGTDLSSLHFDVGSGHLLVLSEESRLLVELDSDGRPLSSLPLSEGRAGLQASVPQAEGVSMDGQGRLYLVSEPNLFYRFSRPGVEDSSG